MAKSTSTERSEAGTVVLNGGEPFNMMAVYHGAFAAGDPYNIPPSQWTTHVQFTDYIYKPEARTLHRKGRVSGSLQSSGANDLEVILDHTYDLPGREDPKLLWYSHRIPRFKVFRYGFLVLDTRSLIVDAMEWDFLGRDPGADLRTFDQVSAFLSQTVNVIPDARLLFVARAT